MIDYRALFDSSLAIKGLPVFLREAPFTRRTRQLWALCKAGVVSFRDFADAARLDVGLERLPLEDATNYLATARRTERALAVIEAARNVPTEHDPDPTYCGAGLCGNCELVEALKRYDEAGG